MIEMLQEDTYYVVLEDISYTNPKGETRTISKDNIVRYEEKYEEGIGNSYLLTIEDSPWAKASDDDIIVYRDDLKPQEEFPWQYKVRKLGPTIVEVYWDYYKDELK